MENSLFEKSDMQGLYVAHQNTSALDEIQRMCIGYMNGHPMALEGTPGTGKNHAISFLAKAFEKKEYRIRCTEEMLARDVIGGDILSVEHSDNGSIATKSEFSRGKLMHGMRENQFVILDEFNQLQPTVQKAFNSALEETKTIDSLSGGYETTAQCNFGLFITYNPDSGVHHHDLEPSVKDRCKIIHFDQLDPSLKTYLALIKTNNISLNEIIEADSFELRGLVMSDKTPQFVSNKGGAWRNLYTGCEVDAKKVHMYAYKSSHNELPCSFSRREQIDLYRVANSIVKVMDDLDVLRTKGTGPFVDAFQDYRLHSVSRLNIAPSSPRIVNKLIQDYKQMKVIGVPDKDIMSDLVLSIVDYSILNREHSEKIGKNITLSGLIHQICARKGLLTAHAAEDIRQKVLCAATEGAVRAFVDQGFTADLAMELVSEYVGLNTEKIMDDAHNSGQDDEFDRDIEPAF
jgi:hypothetical protein